ncbi:MAG: DUF551 domain-containing protein [Pseudomonadota bacterium]
MSEWIDVNEELPEVGDVVIVMEDFKYGDEKKYNPYVIPEDIGGAIYWHDKKFYIDHPTSDYPCTLDNVTHWMQIPEPPEQ